jgi:hypothetical protein
MERDHMGFGEFLNPERFMKKNWTLLATALIVSMLALSACSKKGGGSNAAPPTGSDNGQQPGTPVTATRGVWEGYIDIQDRQLMKELLRSSRACSGNCRFEGGYLTLRVNGPQLPGNGSFQLNMFNYHQWSNQVRWAHTLYKNTVAIPLNNGFQFNYNVNGGGWHGGPTWPRPRPQEPVCYWRELPRQGSQWWIQLGLNGNNGNLNAGFGNNQQRRYEYYCEEVWTMHGQQQQPQVVDPQGLSMQQDPQMASQFWAGHQVQIIAEYTDASRTCVRVRVYFKGQQIAQGELRGIVYQ